LAIVFLLWVWIDLVVKTIPNLGDDGRSLNNR